GRGGGGAAPAPRSRGAAPGANGRAGLPGAGAAGRWRPSRARASQAPPRRLAAVRPGPGRRSPRAHRRRAARRARAAGGPGDRSRRRETDRAGPGRPRPPAGPDPLARPGARRSRSGAVRRGARSARGRRAAGGPLRGRGYRRRARRPSGRPRPAFPAAAASGATAAEVRVRSPRGPRPLRPRRLGAGGLGSRPSARSRRWFGVSSVDSPAALGLKEGSSMQSMAFHFDPLLVGLSYVVSVFGAYTSLRLVLRMRNARGRAFGGWLLGAALAMGGGAIWAMHFIGMIAVKMDMPVRYDVATTAASMVLAVIVTGIGLWIVGRGAARPARLVAAGTFTGLGVAGMHYLGMAAMRMPADLTYDTKLVALSVVI